MLEVRNLVGEGLDFSQGEPLPVLPQLGDDPLQVLEGGVHEDHEPLMTFYLYPPENLTPPRRSLRSGAVSVRILVEAKTPEGGWRFSGLPNQSGEMQRFPLLIKKSELLLKF